MRHALAMGRELPELPVSVPGPFGLADQAYIRRVLDAGGFGEIALTDHQASLELGRDANDAYRFMCAMGLTKGLTRTTSTTTPRSAPSATCAS